MKNFKKLISSKITFEKYYAAVFVLAVQLRFRKFLIFFLLRKKLCLDALQKYCVWFKNTLNNIF